MWCGEPSTLGYRAGQELQQVADNYGNYRGLQRRDYFSEEELKEASSFCHGEHFGGSESQRSAAI